MMAYTVCGVLSRYPYKVGDHKSPKGKKNTWKAELGHTAFYFSIIFVVVTMK